MARSSRTAQEFIQLSFSPIVAVLCSPKVENVVSKNNLSFTELLQPFACTGWEGQFREPGGSVCIVKNWKLIFRDVNWKPLQPTEARRQLNNAVLHNFNEKTSSLEIDGRRLDVPQSTPWFDAWRDTYLEVQFPSDHEYTKHFLSCIIVATTHDDNIVDTFNALNQQYAQLQNVTPPKLPKWFNNEILKSYLLLHDVSSVPKEKADASFEALKQAFGAANCFMLSINSKSTLDPCLPSDYWTQFIKRSSDINIDVMSSSLTSTPIEPQSTFPSSNVPKEDNIQTASSQEGLHPLTTSELDVYDNANSLQTHSFSGSSESVSVSGKMLDFSTEIHGAALNANDIDAVKRFLQDYACKAFLPHLEKQISQLSEGVATKKGVSRSLISATKRWFNTGKGGNTTVNNTVIYSPDCPELQLRRLGDLWFLCGQWQRAFDAYHAAKREFYADSAWLCYAGALEMAALSAFMAGEANRKTHGYMEESIVTYLNTCRMVQYAVRATLLSVVCLGGGGGGGGLAGEAARQLIRMTSEDSDLRSAMLLEQAALAFLAAPRPMCRKYSFHMVLAGHRFSKSGQKKHAYRCYKQAYQVFEESGWRLATDHVQFALGRLAGALRRAGDAARWLRGPLAPRSQQPPAQQLAFLHEYMRAHQQWIENSDEYKDRLPPLPLPLLESGATTVLCVGPAPLSSPGRVPASSLNPHEQELMQQETHYWAKMEEMLLQVVQGSVPMIFKPTIDLYTEKTDSNPVVPQGEPIQISITLRNPLKIGLALRDVELLWQFTPSQENADLAKESPINNEPAVATGTALENNVIFGQKIKSVILEGDSIKVLTFSVTPMQVGLLYVQGFAYKLVNSGESGIDSGTMTIAGKVDLVSRVNDKMLQITVIPHVPCLQMTFSSTSPEALDGELRAVEVELRNVGPVDMPAVFLAVSHPDCVRLVPAAADPSLDPHPHPAALLYDDKFRPPLTYPDERAARAAAWRSAAARHVARAARGVARGGAARARLLLRASARAPALRLLAYHATGDPQRPYRLLRHVFRFRITEAVELSATPRRSVRIVDGTAVENMNIAVEIKNVYSENDEEVALEILESHLLSRQWKLTDLVAARNKDEPLMPHERLHLVFKAKRILEALPDGEIDTSQLKISNISDSTDSDAPSYSKFPLESNRSYLDDPEGAEQDKSTEGLVRSMLVVRWRMSRGTRERAAAGQHCLWLDGFSRAESRPPAPAPPALDDLAARPAPPAPPAPRAQDSAVALRLHHDTHISHNFNQTKLCLVPITINVVNCYEVPVQVFIDLSKQQNRAWTGVLGWAGALSEGEAGAEGEAQRLGVRVALARLESRAVRARALCAQPGTYLVAAATAAAAAPAAAAASAAAAAAAPADASLLVVRQA